MFVLVERLSLLALIISTLPILFFLTLGMLVECIMGNISWVEGKLSWRMWNVCCVHVGTQSLEEDAGIHTNWGVCFWGGNHSRIPNSLGGITIRRTDMEDGKVCWGVKGSWKTQALVTWGVSYVGTKWHRNKSEGEEGALGYKDFLYGEIYKSLRKK